MKKVIKQPISLTTDEALVLQQISEHGEDDLISLSHDLHMNRHRVIEQLNRLRRKGLITVRATYDDWWVQTSIRGKRLVAYMWPELAPVRI